MPNSPWILNLSRVVMIVCSLSVIIRCLRSMLRDRYDPETWAFLKLGKQQLLPVTHWENLLGRSRSADLQLEGTDVRRFHAVLRRTEDGAWRTVSCGTEAAQTDNPRELR